MPRHLLPDPEVWDGFCDLLASASPWLEQRQPSPDRGLSSEQFAVGLLVSAIDHLLVSSHQPSAFIRVAQRLGTAWQHLRTGVPDALLISLAGAGRAGPEQAVVWFRAEIIRLLDQIAARRGVAGRPAALRPIALEIQSALRQARAPKGCIPSAQTILNMHAQAATPRTPTDRTLAEVRRSIEASVPSGDTIADRVRWILAELAMWPGRRP